MDAIKTYTSRRMLTLGAIGFSSGLPLMLVGGTLQQWLFGRGVGVAALGFLSLVTLPYVLKVLWAPLMDRWRPGILGPRRGWLLVTQGLIVLTVAGLGITGQTLSVAGVGLLAMLIAVFSASQDIVADGYRTDLLRADERGEGAAIFVTGYRIAMIVTGAGASILVGQGWMDWGAAYLLMAGMMGVGILGTIHADEPDSLPPQPMNLREAIVAPLAEFLSRRDGVMVLLFVVLFRLPDSIAGAMTVPFLLDIGVSNTQIGLYRNAMGVATTIAGTLLGGVVVNALGLRKSLWVFGILQAVSNLGFWLLSLAGMKVSLLIGVLAVENFCGGLAVAGFFAFLMSQCDRRFTVTQYALLSSLMAVMGTLMGSFSGLAAGWLGWSGFFMMSVLASLPALALLLLIHPSNRNDDVSMSPT